ncbi:hypothetical protein F0726_01593 [Acidithiobacillus caldus]|nr:hypothetical protein F0726_01593 [Acidithiobacillus caldus]
MQEKFHDRKLARCAIAGLIAVLRGRRAWSKTRGPLG